MNKNIGNGERIARGVIGLGILSLAFTGPQSVWGYLGIIPLGTAIVGWCPPYALLGVSTCKKETA